MQQVQPHHIFEYCGCNAEEANQKVLDPIIEDLNIFQMNMLSVCVVHPSWYVQCLCGLNSSSFFTIFSCFLSKQNSYMKTKKMSDILK